MPGLYLLSDSWFHFFLPFFSFKGKPALRLKICFTDPQVCNYRSSFFSDVETHFRTVHENTKELLCPFCLKVLRSSHMYMQHYMKHQVCCYISSSLSQGLFLEEFINFGNSPDFSFWICRKVELRSGFCFLCELQAWIYVVVCPTPRCNK